MIPLLFSQMESPENIPDLLNYMDFMNLVVDRILLGYIHKP